MFVPTNIISPFITWSRSLIKLIFASSNPGKTVKNHECHKTHLASLPLINAISNQYGFLEKRFQLGNLKLCTSPCKYYSCAYMLLWRYINSQLVSLLRADASRGAHRHGRTTPVQRPADSTFDTRAYQERVLSLYKPVQVRYWEIVSERNQLTPLSETSFHSHHFLNSSKPYFQTL